MGGGINVTESFGRDAGKADVAQPERRSHFQGKQLQFKQRHAAACAVRGPAPKEI